MYFLSLTKNLTNYWPMDNNINDIAGGAHLYNGYNVEFVKDRFGNPNSAMRFSDGYYQVPPGVYFNVDFTISVWLKLNVYLTNSKIIDFGNAFAEQIVFKTSPANNKAIIYVYQFNYESLIDEPSLPLIIGQWAHLVFTLSENTGFFYMNGLLVSQTNGIYFPFNILRESNYIGKSSRWNEDGNLWADLDELRFYNRSMSQAEVNYLFLQQQVNAQSSGLNKYVNYLNY